ncbi:MAG: VCBS repeat-containing protein [Elusimicrobia bacterium]|nr:VCBS repeat-containing protein [Elusimicrobiota bacterium]
MKYFISLYFLGMGVPSAWGQPTAIGDLAAVQDAQVQLTWTVPSPQPDRYDIHWSTTGPISSDADFSTATALGVNVAGWAVNTTPNPTTSGSPGTSQTLMVHGLKPRTTFYWAIKSSSDGGLNWSLLDTSSPRPAAQTGSYKLFQKFRFTFQPTINTDWGDFDRDGDPDIWITNGNILRNDVSTFTVLNLAARPTSLGDFNGDGYMDYISFDKVYRGNGTDSFTLFQTLPGMNSTIVSAFGDFNQDGRQDILMASYTASGFVPVHYFRNEGNSFTLVWSSTESLFSANSVRGIQPADMDHDGLLDFLACSDVVDRIYIFKNNGNETFSGVQTTAGCQGPHPRVADFDQDGDLDIATNSGIYRNQGNFSFSQVLALSGAIGLAWGDIDQDGYLDLSVSGSPGGVYHNNAGGSFSLSQTFTLDPDPWGPTLALADFDSDGDLDMAVFRFFERSFVFQSLESEFGTINSTPTPPGGVGVSAAPNGILELTWNSGNYDGSFSSQSLYYQVAAATCTASPCLTLSANGLEVTGPSQLLISPQDASPLLGTHTRPRLSDTQPGMRLKFDELPENASYYFRVATLDSGLRRSTWSSEVSVYVSEPPSAVLDLSTAPVTSSEEEAWLAWTAPGDNGTSGRAESYEIRYSTELITSGNFSQASLWRAARPVGGPGGSSETETVTGLSATTTYYFALKTKDPTGNVSGISNGVFYTTGMDVLPGVSQYSPSEDSPGVLISTTISTRFTKAMSTPSFDAGFTLTAIRDKDGVSISQAVPGSFSFSTKTLVFTPSSSLLKNHTYEVRISTDCKDLFNAPLASGVTWQFVTFFDYSIANTIVSLKGPRFSLPANAFSEDGAISVSTSVSNAAIQAASQKLTGQDRFKSPLRTLDIKALNTSGALNQPNALITAVVSYNDSDQDGFVDGSNPPLREKTLALWWLDETSQTWSRIPGARVDVQANTLTSSLPHFSVFGMIGAEDTSLQDVFAYPVPYVPSRQATRVITFKNLSSKATLRIFSVSGDLVREIEEADGDGITTWDVRNSEGEDVASGLYLYLIENDQEKEKGELIVVK